MPRIITTKPQDLAADRAAALALTHVSHETAERLDRLVALLLEWLPRTNLIAPSTVGHLWTRHIADSLQLLDLAPDAIRWVDLGSGAGFPGLVVAAALSHRPGAMVHLVESNNKKAAFLRAAIQHISVPATVHAVRIEDFVQTYTGPIDVVTARALAPLRKLIELAHPLLQKGAQGLFLKGQDVGVELTEAAKYWNIDADLVPSKTSPQSRVVVVRSLQRRNRD